MSTQRFSLVCIWKKKKKRLQDSALLQISSEIIISGRRGYATYGQRSSGTFSPFFFLALKQKQTNNKTITTGCVFVGCREDGQILISGSLEHSTVVHVPPSSF